MQRAENDNIFPKMPHLQQEADNEIMTNRSLFPLMGLVATQFLVILDYIYINAYF